MPTVHASVAIPWSSGAAVHGPGVALPWDDGRTVHSVGGPYTAPPPPGGGTPAVPSTDPRFVIAAADSYLVTHAQTVTDLRDGASLDVESLTMRYDEDALFWSLSMTGTQALMDKLKAGTQPSAVEITLDGMVWRFLVDAVIRSRSFPSAAVQVSGRSLTAAAGAPYEFEKTWSIDGDTTAAQIAASANILTGLNVVWGLSDWPIPDRVFSHFGTPLQVVKRVADAVGAMVLSDRKELTVRVLPRYPLLPNEWPVVAPDVEIALAALQTESFTQADRPEYDGVYVMGQQQGAAAFVKLDGTSGANQHPLVTDLLLTDVAACTQRAQAVLGASGQQQTHTLTLPVLTGAGEPGVLEVGWLARIVEPGGPTWYGLIRSVSVTSQLPSVTQTVVLERHTKPIPGTTEGAAASPALLFTGPLPPLVATVGTPATFDLSAYYSLGSPPYTYSVRSGTLPAWATLDPLTGVLSVTAPAPAAAVDVQFRATDALNSTADSTALAISAIAGSGYPAASAFDVLFKFNEADGETASIVNTGTAAISFPGTDKQRVSHAYSKFGSGSLRLGGVAVPTSPSLADPCFFLANGASMTLGVWVRPDQLGNYGKYIQFRLDVGTTRQVFFYSGPDYVACQIQGSKVVGSIVTAQAYPVSDPGEFHFCEVCINATNAYLFIDGALLATATFNGSVPSGPNGSVFTPLLYSSGGSPETDPAYFDNLFVLRDTCVHTASYTPPGDFV